MSVSISVNLTKVSQIDLLLFIVNLTQFSKGQAVYLLIESIGPIFFLV